MEGAFKKTERRGLPGGPNEVFTYTTGVFSTQGYKADSPDVDNPFNIIPSGNITMDGVEFPVHGVDNLGNSSIMLPGNDYEFPGDMVLERPIQDLNLKNNSSRKNVLGYGFAFPETREGNFIAGAGVNFLPIGTQFAVTGVLPMQSNPVFKGVGTAGVSQQIGDFNIGIGANKDFINNPETGQRLDTPIKPSFNVKYTKTFQEGGEKEMSFEEWYKTVPESKNDTISYNLRRAYELAPQEELDAFVNTKAHLNTAYMQPDGIYEFVKRKDHPTVQKEIDWFNSPDAAEFRKQYRLDDSGDYYRYIPKQQTGGDVDPYQAVDWEDYHNRDKLYNDSLISHMAFEDPLSYSDGLPEISKEEYDKIRNKAYSKDYLEIRDGKVQKVTDSEQYIKNKEYEHTNHNYGIYRDFEPESYKYYGSNETRPVEEGVLTSKTIDSDGNVLKIDSDVIYNDRYQYVKVPYYKKPVQEILKPDGKPLEEKKIDRETYYYDGSEGPRMDFKTSAEPLKRERKNIDIPRKTMDLSEALSLEPELKKEVYYRQSPSQFPNVQIRHYDDGSKTFVNADGQEVPYTYGQMPNFNKEFQYQDGGERKALIPDTSFLNTDFKEWGDDEFLNDGDLRKEYIEKPVGDLLKKQLGGDTEKKTTLKIPSRELYNPIREQVKPYQPTSEEDYQQRSQAYSDSLSLHKMSYDKLMSTGWSDKQIDNAKMRFDDAEYWRSRGRTTPAKRGLLVAQDISDAPYREQYEAFLDENMRRGIKRTETFEEFKEMAEGVPGIKSTFAYYPPHAHGTHSPDLYYTNPVQPILPYKDEAEAKAKAEAEAKKAKEAAELKAKQDTFSSIEGSVIPVVMAEDKDDLRGYKFRTKYGEKFVSIDDVDTLKQYSEMYGLELPIPGFQTGREVKVDDGTGNVTTMNTASQEYKDIYPNLVSIDYDGTPVVYMPEIEIAYDKNTGDALPYYSYLTESQKKWLETHQGENDPITRSIRSQAREGYGIDGNPTWMETAGDAARAFSFMGPITALNTLSVPQSLMVEGIEQLRGNPYDYSKAFDISPLNNTRDQGLLYTDQRLPSETLLDEDTHWGLKLGLDILADPTNLIPAKAFGTVAKGASAAAKYKHLLKAKKLGEDIPEAVLKFAERQAIKEYQSGINPFAKSVSQIEKQADNWIPGQKWHDVINPFAGKKYGNMKQELKLKQGQIRKNIREGNAKLMDLHGEQSRMNSWQQGKRFEFADDFRDLSNKNQVTDYLERKMSQYPDPFEIGESRNAQRKITRELEGRDIRLDPEGGILKLEEPGGTQLIYEAADAVRLTPNPNKPIIDFTTGQTYTPKNLAPTAGSRKYTLVDGKVESELVLDGSKRIGFDEGLSNVYSKNENFIKEQMPGFHPMGSSQYHKFGVSHVTNDFDGIIKAEDWNKIKGNFQNVGNSKYGNTVSVRNPDLPGNPVVGEVDVNIIYTNSKTGKAEGGLATELYRQFFPDEFYKASEEAIKKGPGTPITINKTADEILEVYDPEIKSILDAFEAGGSGADSKLKHINKIDYIIEAGDPEKVLKAQELFAKSIIGKNADLGRQYSPQAFSNYENNLKILDAIKNAPNSRTLKASYVPEEIAKDPAKMQIALNDFYLNSSIYTRRINSRHKRINSYEDVLDAYKTWISDGGEAMGAGLNTVKLGEPGLGYGNVVGNRQFKLYDSAVSETPLEYIESVTNKVSGARTITKADKETIIKLAKKNNINLPENTRIETFGDLLDIRAHAIGIRTPGQNVDEIGGFLKDVGEEFGMKAISRDNFGNSEYATVLGNIDDALDNFALSFSEHTPSLKSAKQRAENLRNVERKVNMRTSRVDIDTFAQYKAIEGYLDGGLEVALKREKELQQATRKAMDKQHEIYKELENLYVERKLKQFNEKDGQLAKLTQDKEQADKILSDLYKEQNKNTQALEDLRRRQARLKSMRSNLVAAGLLGGTAAGGVGLVAKTTSDQMERRARRQYVKTLNDDKIKELKKLYPDETYKQLLSRSRGLLYKEFEALSDEEKDKWLDLFNKEREDRLNKKQTGGEMVRDNTYVDIKAPQFYEAPVDNTRVEKKIVPEPIPLKESIDFEGLKKGIAQAESLGGTLMINPESTATGLYGQRFSEIEDSYKGTREDFAKDTTYQEELFKKRFYEGLKDTKTTALQKDAMDLYDEYNMQFEDFPYSYEDIAALSNFLGRQGTREYFGYVLRDGKPLEEVFPTKYGPKAKQANKTPEEYLKITRPYYTKSDGGEILKVYADYINGVLDNTPMYKKGGRIYDKLNRIYYKDAKAVGMSSPNYIMTYLVN